MYRYLTIQPACFLRQPESISHAGALPIWGSNIQPACFLRQPESIAHAGGIAHMWLKYSACLF